jgi:hypothetical protein
MKTLAAIVLGIGIIVIGLLVLFNYLNDNILMYTKGHTENVEESIDMGVFVADYKLLHKDLVINELKIGLEDAWVEYYFAGNSGSSRVFNLDTQHTKLVLKTDIKNIRSEIKSHKYYLFRKYSDSIVKKANIWSINRYYLDIPFDKDDLDFDTITYYLVDKKNVKVFDTLSLVKVVK